MGQGDIMGTIGDAGKTVGLKKGKAIEEKHRYTDVDGNMVFDATKDLWLRFRMKVIEVMGTGLSSFE